MSAANIDGKRTAARGGLTVPSKRRKRGSPVIAPSAAAASSSEFEADAAITPSSSPSASLHEDLVRLVAWRVLAGDFADYVRLRAVCRHWRSSTACPRGRGVLDRRFHPRHWMLLPEGFNLYPGHTRLRGRVRFFNLRTGAFASVALPIFKDHYAMDSVDGLLLLQRDHDMAVRLFHPFTGDIVELPSLATLLPQVAALINPFELALMEEKGLLGILRKVCAAVSFSPGDDDDDGVVTVMLALTSYRASRVAFATSEDQQWTLASWAAPPQHRPGTILSMQGKLYFLTGQLNVLVVEPPQHVGKKKASPSPRAPSSSPPPPPKLIAARPVDNKIGVSVRLAECDSEILLVDFITDKTTQHILIHRLADIVEGRFVPLKSIGGNSLFAWERSICVSSKAHPTIAPDTVVSLHHSFDYLGQYHLGDRTWSVATDGPFLHAPVPSPFTLIHHIYTCCDRYYWNKGHMYCPALRNKCTWGAKSRWRFGG